MADEQRIEALEAQIERLEEQVAALESALGLDFLTPIEWRLTAQQTRLFGVLMARELMTPAAAMAALMKDRGADGGPEPKIIDVQVCKMRKRLGPIGIQIETRWGQGYFLAPETKQRVRSILGESEAS